MLQQFKQARPPLFLLWAAAVPALLGCQPDPAAVVPLYDSAAVETRDIRVTVEASGVIQPEVTVEVKSKASGEILSIHADTGDVVQAGALLVEVDKRTPRNELAEAEAGLIAAKARRSIAETQMKRSQTLFESGTLTQADYETTQLEYANARAEVVSAEVAVENARIAMDDTDVRAPITGTIIERQVEPGAVISSPTQAVSDGTILMKMADLNAVQVRALVDETDIGKIQPGMTTHVTVAAYPNQPFEGEVLKIEPQAVVEQNVTMFAVLIRIDNRSGLLKPGMNAEVSIQIASREDVTAVPTAALRAMEDIPATAAMLGIPVAELESALGRDLAPVGESVAGAANSISVGGRTIALPADVDPQAVSALMTKTGQGGELSIEERALLRRVMGHAFGERSGGGAAPAALDGSERPAGGFARGNGGRRPVAAKTAMEYQFGGEYWVIALRDNQPAPTRVKTGLTDLQYSEVIAGLSPEDRVLLLPSTSLFQQQERLQQFISERFSSGPFQQQQGGRGPR